MDQSILFGVGSYFKEHPDTLPDTVEILGYSYSNESLATSNSGKLYKGKRIYSVKELIIDPLAGNNDISIYICSGPISSVEIFISLKKAGIDVSRIKFIDESHWFGTKTETFVTDDGSLIRRINGHDLVVVGNNDLKNLVIEDDKSAIEENYCLYKIIKNDLLKEAFKNKEFCRIYSEIQTSYLSNLKRIPTDNSKISCAVYCDAGLGDCLIILNFLQELKKIFLDSIDIDFFSHHSSFIKQLNFIRQSEPYVKIQKADKMFSYDIVLEGVFALRSVFVDWDKVSKFDKKLHDYCNYCKEIGDLFFYKEHFLARDFISYAQLKNKKFIDTPDLNGIIKNDYSNSSLFLNFDDCSDCLDKYGLQKEKYILINRAVYGKNANHPKLWPLEQYNNLTKLIKSKYDDIKIIQVGIDDFYGTIENTDLNLLGKLSFEQIAFLLQNSLCLISGEGGLVHLNHFLNGKSLVIFGPTDPGFYGYKENINIQNSKCNDHCQLLGKKFLEECPLNILHLDYLNCMKFVDYKDVFYKLCEFIEHIED